MSAIRFFKFTDKQLLKGESFRPDGYCHKAVCVTTQTADGKEKSGVEWMYDPVVGCKFGRKKVILKIEPVKPLFFNPIRTGPFRALIA